MIRNAKVGDKVVVIGCGYHGVISEVLSVGHRRKFGSIVVKLDGGQVTPGGSERYGRCWMGKPGGLRREE